jgi:hypothetical protein
MASPVHLIELACLLQPRFGRTPGRDALLAVNQPRLVDPSGLTMDRLAATLVA